MNNEPKLVDALNVAIKSVCRITNSNLFNVTNVLTALRDLQKGGRFKEIELSTHDAYAAKGIKKFLLIHDKTNKDMEHKFIPYREVRNHALDGSPRLIHKLVTDINKYTGKPLPSGKYPGSTYFMWVDVSSKACKGYYELYVEYSKYIAGSHAQTHDTKIECGEEAGLLAPGEIKKIGFETKTLK